MIQSQENHLFKLSDKVIGKGLPPFVLAEMACAHDGKVDLAIKMVNDAADAGADGMQFQLFSTSNLLTPDHKFYRKANELEIPYLAWQEVFSVARKRGLKIFVNPLTIDAMGALKSFDVDAVKIHSADLSNPEMIKSLASFSLPVSLSTGASTQEEVGEALDILRSEGIGNLILMHGFQAYPTLINDANLNYIHVLEKSFGLPVGYQDHADGDSQMATILPLLACAFGAVLIEKHITDSRKRKGTDYESALDKSGFKEFVSTLRKSYSSFGSSEKKQLSNAELEYRKTFKKSIVAARDIKEDEVISKEMIAFMRADGFSFAPNNIDKVLGKRSKKAINKFELIKQNFID